MSVGVSAGDAEPVRVATHGDEGPDDSRSGSGDDDNSGPGSGDDRDSSEHGSDDDSGGDHSGPGGGDDDGDLAGARLSAAVSIR